VAHMWVCHLQTVCLCVLTMCQPCFHVHQLQSLGYNNLHAARASSLAAVRMASAY
jgi:hypothetical protein